MPRGAARPGDNSGGSAVGPADPLADQEPYLQGERLLLRTPRTIETFGNAGCRHEDVNPVSLNRYERRDDRARQGLSALANDCDLCWRGRNSREQTLKL